MSHAYQAYIYRMIPLCMLKLKVDKSHQVILKLITILLMIAVRKL